MRKAILPISLLLLVPGFVWSQQPDKKGVKTEYTDFENDTLQLEQVEVNMGRKNRLKLQHVTSNTELIGQQQLVRAACCNLGESFVTNPSVDVDYSDAATGAQQIKLLGLSGTYVQMMTENVPNLRGAALPFSLSFVPGPWMQSIQVSKGASSVRNGYESTTGQINIEFLKPQGVDGVHANAYLDSDLMYEFNFDASHHFTDRLSASILAHFDDFQGAHDDNGDTFIDMPKQRQWNVMPRLAYVAPNWISQFFVRALRDERESGQIGHHAQHLGYTPYTIGIKTDRYEAQWKNGFPFNDDHNTSIALMLHGSWHDAENGFGLREYNVLQKNGYAQLMFETDVNNHHNISVGASMNHDYYKEDYIHDITRKNSDESSIYLEQKAHDTETTSGVYAQYSYKLDEVFTLMAGLRWDNSTRYGGFWTPRVHLKYSPTEWFTIRASAGKGYRTPHALAENVSLMACGRPIYIHGNYKGETRQMQQEEAWNYGTSINFNIPIGENNLELNAEYYYTDFINQMVVNVNDDEIVFENLRKTKDEVFGAVLKDGKSYSHTLQVDASYPLFEGLTALVAYRYNDARTTYLDGKLHQRPLTSRYKGLVSLSYKTPLEFWQFDVTGQLNGPGELYDHQTRYPHYYQLQAQVTREFQHFSLYVGGENLTDYTIKDPIRNAHNPWSPLFDATQVWGPIDGVMFYAGIRFKFEKD